MDEDNIKEVTLNKEFWSDICDAIEIAISKKVLKINNHFAGNEDRMERLVIAIEKQSGCRTEKD